jgi:ABC-type transport system involved in cytochrome bd biosynthesis fused ATPase/permease subunit
MSKKNTIRLTESDLKRVISESVKRMLKEGDGKFMQLAKDNNMDQEYWNCMAQAEKIEEELQELEVYMMELKKKQQQYYTWADEIFKDYASDNYGLSADNIDKNWDNFVASRL